MTKDDALRMMLGPFKAWRNVPGNEDVVEELTKIINAVEKVLAQPEQEPVAWMFENDEDNGHKSFIQTPPLPEVVAYLAKWNRPAWVPLYTTPPQRTWVGLTDEEIDKWTPEIHGVIRAIEAKLKEKNCG